MNDKEQLELAAKVAGKTNWQSQTRWDCDGVPFWNPHRDIGDAIRLGVDLCVKNKMKIQITSDYITCFYNHDGVFVPVTWMFEGKDSNVATCRAITRAAAEVGNLL